MAFERLEFGAKVASDPEGAAAVMRAHVLAGATARTLAEQLGASHSTVLRWYARLRERLGVKLGFELREGRPRAPKPTKTVRQKKKRGRPKKGVEN